MHGILISTLHSLRRNPSERTMLLETLVSLFSALFLLIAFFLARRFRNFPLPLPPGPRGYPVVGNAFNIPANKPWKMFQECAKIYGKPTPLAVIEHRGADTFIGDVIYFRLPMQDLIVLDSIDAVVDLLEKRSELYSDRPTFVMHKL